MARRSPLPIELARSLASRTHAPHISPPHNPNEENSAMTGPKLEVLTPQNSQIIFIDHQPQMAFGVQSIDRQTLKNNTVALAKSAKVFKIPTTVTSVETESFAGYTRPELLDVFPDMDVLQPTCMNSWDDRRTRAHVSA